MENIQPLDGTETPDEINRRTRETVLRLGSKEKAELAWFQYKNKIISQKSLAPSYEHMKKSYLNHCKKRSLEPNLDQEFIKSWFWNRKKYNFIHHKLNYESRKDQNQSIHDFHVLQWGRHQEDLEREISFNEMLEAYNNYWNSVQTQAKIMKKERKQQHKKKRRTIKEAKKLKTKEEIISWFWETEKKKWFKNLAKRNQN